MKYERGKLYDDSSDYFRLEGDCAMWLTAEAAISVCGEAIQHEMIVIKAEGAIAHTHGFEVKYDCIWDGLDPPTGREEARINNHAAIDFIREEHLVHDVFLITTCNINEESTKTGSSPKTSFGRHPKNEPVEIYGSRNGYMVVNPKTGKVLQLSIKNDPAWIADSRIKWANEE